MILLQPRVHSTRIVSLPGRILGIPQDLRWVVVDFDSGVSLPLVSHSGNVLLAPQVPWMASAVPVVGAVIFMQPPTPD